jgi:hypothetical protein
MTFSIATLSIITLSIITLSRITLSITTLSITTLGITTLSIMTLSLTTQSIRGLYVTLSISDIKQKRHSAQQCSAIKLSAIMLSVTFNLLLC